MTDRFTESDVERLARSMFAYRHRDVNPDHEPLQGVPAWTMYRDEAREHLRALTETRQLR